MIIIKRWIEIFDSIDSIFDCKKVKNNVNDHLQQFDCYFKMWFADNVKVDKKLEF